MRHRFLPVLIAVALFAGASVGVRPASAVTESGDAGDTLATAQVTGAATTIVGTVSAHGDVDIYRITISTPTAFSASTLGSGWDTMLGLFDSAGHLVEYNDDSNAAAYNNASLLPATAGNPYAPQTAGTYYVSVSAYDVEPRASVGSSYVDMVGSASWWDSGTSTYVYGPTDTSYVLAEWHDYSGTPSGAYTLTLTGVGALPGPSVASHVPLENATINLGSNEVQVTFSQPVTTATVSVTGKGARLSVASQTELPAESVTFTMNRDFGRGKTYTVTVTGENSNGTTQHTWSFSVVKR